MNGKLVEIKAAALAISATKKQYNKTPNAIRCLLNQSEMRTRLKIKYPVKTFICAVGRY